MKIFKHLFLSVIALSLSMTIVAQTPTPYSRYGYGILQDNETSAQRAMGGVGYAMSSGRQINVKNPAAYAKIDSLTFLFDMGINFSKISSEEGDNKHSDFGGGIDYITMAFPINKYIGASAGLLPFSSVSYSFGQEIVHGSNSREGKGGINQLYFGVGGQVLNNLTLGANVSYLFGTLINDVYAYTSTGTSLFERVMKVKDWRLQFGAQYSLNLDPKNKLTFGATFSPGKTLLGETWGTIYDIDNDEVPDATIGNTSTKNKFSLPDCWGLGISYEWNNRLITEVDFTYQTWGKADYTNLENFENTKLDNRWEIAAGAQFTPKPRGNYLQRIQYRMGTFYNHDYLMVGNNNVIEYGFTAGLGLPVKGFKTIVNLGFEYRHRQADPNPLIKENFLNFTLGVNFNEMWFWKNKIR